MDTLDLLPSNICRLSRGRCISMSNDLSILYDDSALLYRLHQGLEETDKQVVFVVGAPVSAPSRDVGGVGDVNAVIELIRSHFSTRGNQLANLDVKLASSTNRYQTAFEFLVGRAGPDAANRIVKRAVAQALISSGERSWGDVIADLPEDELGQLDRNFDSWNLPPAIKALGQLIARHPKRFGRVVLTSNFDPLLEVAIGKNGGRAWRTSLSTDGSLFQSQAQGCQVVHIHGYWHGTDTLHTGSQLLAGRPTLANDLLKLLQGSIVVVMAYGGWPDVFTSALRGVIANDNLMPDILWTFFDPKPNPSEYLVTTLQPGLARNRVTLYTGIDCHTFLPRLLTAWDEGSDGTVRADEADKALPANLDQQVRPRKAQLFKLSPLECDRPPTVAIWVGRDAELRALETSSAKVVIICGIGGEGKSALASYYISRLSENEDSYRLWDWRDCKEQSDRIRTQISEVIVRFSQGLISADDLAGSDDQELVEVFIDQTFDARAVLVFDNVDSYIDLEHGTFTGLLDTLVQAMANSPSTSRIVLTCRPDVHYTSASIATFSIKGISQEEAAELFEKRNPGLAIPETDIREAWISTNGHAFWLDLLAVQINQVPGTTLAKQLANMTRGKDNFPDVLSSIWDRLALREHILLRLMAEAVRPENEKTIEKFAASQLGYDKFRRAFRSLRSLNLIVVKPVDNAPDLFDLHPLVRQFVRLRFNPSQRASFIKVVLNQYASIIGAISAMLGASMPFTMLERWTQKVELEVSGGFIEDAFQTLSSADDALIGGGHTQEYVRVARLLFQSIDWETAATKYAKFDHTVSIMVGALEQLGDRASAESMLSNYEATIPQKTTRYINFCNVRAFSFWLRKEFDLAVDWASRGVKLKNETHVDTDFDCEHTLALAQRDSGDPETALKYFLNGRTLPAIIGSALDATSDGPMHGNVGRCLQLMGNTADALQCFKKSAVILEQDGTLHGKSNRAYARKWIAESMVAQNDLERAKAFIVDAMRILGAAAPVRVRELWADLEIIRRGDASVMTEASASRIVSKWISS